MRRSRKRTGGNRPTSVFALDRQPNIFTPETNLELGTAVAMWKRDIADAMRVYGHISGWNTKHITNMSELFRDDSTFNDDIGRWNVANVTNMDGMFYGARSFDQDIGGWDVGNVTNMNTMFYEAEAFDRDIGGWNVSEVKDMQGMFGKAMAFNRPIGDWNVGKVTDMSDMFMLAARFNHPIGEWDVSNVVDMSYMFYGAETFNHNIRGWSVGSVRRAVEMFEGADAFNIEFAKGVAPRCMTDQEYGKCVKNEDGSSAMSSISLEDVAQKDAVALPGPEGITPETVACYGRDELRTWVELHQTDPMTRAHVDDAWIRAHLGKSACKPVEQTGSTYRNLTQTGGTSTQELNDFNAAIKEGDINYVHENIDDIDDFDLKDENGDTPMDIAIMNYIILPQTYEVNDDRLKIITMLILHGTYDDLNLDGLNLMGAQLSGAHLMKASFKNGGLVGADLNYAYLHGADFEDAYLDGASLMVAHLVKANFKGAILADGRADGTLDCADLRGANLTMANFTGAFMRGVNLNGANLTNADFTGADMENVQMDYSTVIDGAIFTGTVLEDGVEIRQMRDITHSISDPVSPDHPIGPLTTEQMLHHEQVALDAFPHNPFLGRALSGFDVILQENVNYCQHIRADPGNILMLFGTHAIFIDTETLASFIDPNSLNPDTIVYQCREIDQAFMARPANIVGGPMLNMTALGFSGPVVPLEYMDAIVASNHQIFVIKPDASTVNEMPIASLGTRMGGDVVSANHCQAMVNKQVCKAYYVENKVLLDACGPRPRPRPRPGPGPGTGTRKRSGGRGTGISGRKLRKTIRQRGRGKGMGMGRGRGKGMGKGRGKGRGRGTTRTRKKTKN